MRGKLIDRIVGAAVFCYALILYGLTVAPSVSFWDAGEYIAVANKLEVSHPPGAPFFELLGRLFSMFVPAAYVPLSVNLISVLASAGTVLLTHLIIVHLIRYWTGRPREWSFRERLMSLGGGVIGAAAYAVTDSFWFNAVEAEVYALSMFFTAVVVWLVLRWSDRIRRKIGDDPTQATWIFGQDTDRYLLLIAYLFGLAIGVHLLNLLALFFIGLIIFFVAFDRPEWSTQQRWQGIVVTGLISAGVFLLIYPTIIQFLPSWAGASGSPTFFLLAVFGAVVLALYYTHRKRMYIPNVLAISVALILIGYSTYSLLFIRSAADPPIDENDPETAESIVSYLNRAQYGDVPLLKGQTYNDQTGQIDEESWFPRRHSPSPRHKQKYAQYSSDFEFFWEYQVGHMYVRYFLWNFVGKAKDTQDSGFITGLSADEPQHYVYQTPSEQASRNAYFALPLLLGLFGLFYHFSRDWKRAFSVLTLFLVTGLGIIVYLNQTPFQPRERDYSYVASFFAFSLWIGIGASGLIELAYDATRETLNKVNWSRIAGIGAGVLIFLAVPGWMMVENYDDHDRSGRYVAWDYAYNLLQSVSEDAILFTNGDNDTFPLWYLQEVEGIRRDVRIVNLSLLNTKWYIKQMKNQWAREAAPVPMSMTNEQIEQMSVRRWNPDTLRLPVPSTSQLIDTVPAYESYLDTADVQRPMRWRIQGRQYSQDTRILLTADQAVIDILATNAQNGWKRPIYFAVTTSPDAQVDLSNYFHLEGLAYRILPVSHDQRQGRVIPEIALERIDKFQFRNISDPDVYYDTTIRRMMDNYRNIFTHIAEALRQQGHPEKALDLLNTFTAKVPFETIPGRPSSIIPVAQAYYALKAPKQAQNVLQNAEPLVLNQLQRATSTQAMNRASRMASLLQYTYLRHGDYEAASAFSRQFGNVLGDTSHYRTVEELKQEFGGQSAPAPDSPAPAPTPLR